MKIISTIILLPLLPSLCLCSEIVVKEIAKKAVAIMLGQENTYIERLLQQQLAEMHGITIANDRPADVVDRAALAKYLHDSIEAHKPIAVQTLLAVTLPTASTVNPSEVTPLMLSNENPHAVTSQSQTAINNWIINTLLQEKLKDKNQVSRCNKQKYAALIVAILGPVATFLIQHYFIECNPFSS